MVSLDKILGKDTKSCYDLILIDGCIFGRDTKSFCWDIYDDWNYGCLDCDEIKKEIDCAEEFYQILQHSKTRTISEITKELEEKNRIIGENINFFSRIEKGINKRAKKRYQFQRIDAKKLMKKLQEITYEIFRTSKEKEWQKDKEIRFDRKKYDSIVEMVKLLSKEMELKLDTAYYVYGKHEKDMSFESDTDEKLVAAAYYLSMYSNKKPIILTRDTDIIEIVKTTPTLIGADEFLPYNADFRQGLIWNPIQIYFRNGNDFEFPKKQWSRGFYRKAFIQGATKERGLAIRSKIKHYWQNLKDN
jgi:hypothetical protein